MPAADALVGGVGVTEPPPGAPGPERLGLGALVVGTTPEGASPPGPVVTGVSPVGGSPEVGVVVGEPVRVTLDGGSIFFKVITGSAVMMNGPLPWSVTVRMVLRVADLDRAVAMIS